MGLTLEHYPPASTVLQAHAHHLSRQTPTLSRYVDAAVIADHLAQKQPERVGCTLEHRDRVLQHYLAVLNREDWSETARAELASDSWFASNVAARLHLQAFTNAEADAGTEPAE